MVIITEEEQMEDLLEAYRRGYAKGEKEGYDKGCDEGYDIGFLNGEEAGWEEAMYNGDVKHDRET